MTFATGLRDLLAMDIIALINLERSRFVTIVHPLHLLRRQSQGLSAINIMSNVLVCKA